MHSWMPNPAHAMSPTLVQAREQVLFVKRCSIRQQAQPTVRLSPHPIPLLSIRLSNFESCVLARPVRPDLVLS